MADSHQASAITGIAREDLESEILTAKDEKTSRLKTLKYQIINFQQGDYAIMLIVRKRFAFGDA